MTILVGGIAAGKYADVPLDTDYYRVVETRPISYREMTQGFEFSNPAATMRNTIYRRMSLKYSSDGKEVQEFMFFVDPVHIRDEYDLIRELANGYRPVQTQTV